MAADPGARAAILAALAATAKAPVEASVLCDGPWLHPADPAVAFRESLEAAGGECLVLEAAELAERIEAIRRELGASRVFSVLEPAADVEAARVQPSALADLDLAVLRGGPAVAESGAVWWQPQSLAERAAGFLAEHVVLVVRHEDLVPELHAAYARIQPEAAPFGCFVSGPSKTADIEQALVIGAHGPRSLRVLRVVGLPGSPAGVAPLR